MTIIPFGYIMLYMLKKTRKRRNDRNQVIYLIQNTLTGEEYIGLTALSYKGNVYKTLYRRMQKHLQRALAESKEWGLCESLRKHGPQNFVFMKLEIIRGKREAHVRETALIKEFNPALNTFK